MAAANKTLSVDLPANLVDKVRFTAQERQQTIKVVVMNALTDYLEKDYETPQRITNTKTYS